MLTVLANTVALWGVLALASLPLYFGLRGIVPGLPGIAWWMLAVGVGATVLMTVWGRDAFYLTGKYVLTTLLALGLPALAISLARRK
jgi:hypothetical protein